MAIREYIGARYVTKIYENSLDPSSAEWESGVTYEPLTLVTYLNSSYLSKKEVPGAIGNPAANPSYWVVTGAYNGQILNLQNQIDAINDDLTIMKEFIVTPEMFGAEGDGTTDDTMAFQEALNAGKNVFCENTYLITSTLTVPDGVSIFGSGTITTDTRTNIFDCQGNNKIFNLTFTDNLPYDTTTGFYIYAKNTSEIFVENCKFNTVGNGRCIVLEHCTECDIKYNKMVDYCYSGVMLLGTCRRVNIEYNYLYNARYQGALHNYPISFSAYDDYDHGVATQIKCNYNYIEEITPCWEGIDSHGAKNYEIKGNIIKNTRYGIALGCKRTSSATEFTDANNNCSITDNYIMCDDPDSTGATGIQIACANVADEKNIIVSNNYFDITSLSSAETSAISALTFRPSGKFTNVIVENNTFKCSSVHGIALDAAMFKDVSIRNNYFETLTTNYAAIYMKYMDDYEGIEIVNNNISSSAGGNKCVVGPDAAPSTHQLIEVKNNDFAGLTFQTTNYTTVKVASLLPSTKSEGVTGQFIPKVGSDTVMGWFCQSAGNWYAISGTSV